ncbi:hypothetical protein niasHT_012017 [Heterodera trifolii]|uniref:Ubiquitin carboxyl-terminal hydrolase n=1 Tax=Heterodera trifolii TaxID=157864 RepID=A0ABD2KWH9_9BILA
MSAVAPSAHKGQKAEKEISHDEPDKHFMIAYETATQRISKESDRKQTPIGHTGLVNVGNSCFMNAILQPLLHAPIFSQLFHEKRAQGLVNWKNGIISGAFSALIDMALSGDFRAISPAFFLEMIALHVRLQFVNGEQHDAQEFQIYLLDALHQETNRANGLQTFEQNYDSSNLRKSASDFFKRSQLFSSSPINDLFNVTTISVIQCSTCSTTSVLFEAMNQISVELPTNKNCLNLKDCLEAHFSPTNLEDNWDCPKCKSKQPATQSTKIWTVPLLLIIQLNRFSQRDGKFEKNEVELTFDVDELDLAPFLHDKSPLKIAAFGLYGLTDHIGQQLDSGHYTSSVANFATKDKEWLNFNDAICKPCDAPSSSKNVYILHYQQIHADSGSDAEAADSGTSHDRESSGESGTDSEEDQDGPDAEAAGSGTPHDSESSGESGTDREEDQE